MKWSIAALGAVVLLLLLADFLAFHDLFEPHTGTEWIVLVASVLAVIALVGEASTRFRTVDRKA